jgi:hypothetical protein
LHTNLIVLVRMTMALNGYVTHAERHWTDDGEEQAPITSRSPSFVRLKGADDVRETPSIESLVTEVAPNTVSTAPPPPPDSSTMRARCQESAVDLEVRLLQLEESAVTIGAIEDARVAQAVRCLIGDVRELDELLRETTFEKSLAIVQHVYEWMVNVVAQADARIAAAKRGEEPLESIGLSVAEYSSLFVRAIILPMIHTQVAEREAGHDVEEAQALARVRDLVAWTNWTIGRITVS